MLNLQSNKKKGKKKSTKEPGALRLIDTFAKLYEKAGIDYPQMRLIVANKLKMDGRSASNGLNRGNQQVEEGKNNFFSTLWVYAFLGVFMIIFLFVGKNLMVQYGLIFSYFLILLLTTLISSFSSLLLDFSDRELLSVWSVSDKTISGAKMTHVLICLSYLLGVMATPVVIASFFIHGIMIGLVLIPLLLLFSSLVVVLTIFIYFLVLQFFDGERLKNVINGIQIAMSIFIFAGSQLISRIMGLADLNLSYSFNWWQVIVFPLWYAAPLDWLATGRFSIMHLLFSSLAVFGSVLAVFIYLKNAEKFEENSKKLNSQSQKNAKASGLFLLFRRLLCKESLEKNFFTFTWRMIQNQREFKLRLYPSVGIAIVMPIIMIFGQIESSSLAEIQASSTYYFIYGFMFIIPALCFNLSFGGQSKASWILLTTPLKNHDLVLKGTLKALLVRLVLPFYLVLAVAIFIVFGVKSLPVIVNCFLSCWAVLLVYGRLTIRNFPFSQEYQVAKGGQGCLISLLSFVVAIVFGLVNFGLSWLSGGSYGFMLILIILLVCLQRFAFKGVRLMA